MRYYIGLDNGGTTTKAAIFDSFGNEVGSYSIDTELITFSSGYAERDMEKMWEANCGVIYKVLEKTNISPKDVACIGLSGHGKGLYLWSKEDKPLRYGILSTDQRALEIVKKWQESGVEAAAYEYSYQHIMACQPVAILSWLKQNEPENYANIKWIFECKDYIRFRLTGIANAELTDYSGTNLLNLKTKNYDKKLLELFGIEEIENALPPICNSDSIVGTINKETSAKTGLLEGTPVIGGMFDIDACAIGSGVIDESKICIIAGTWSINEYLRKEPVLDKRVKMNSLFAISNYYLIEESSPTSAGNLEWFIRDFLPELQVELKARGKSIHEEVDKWVEEIDVKEFVPIFLPFVMASNVHPNAKGSLIGMTLFHTRKHIVRAFFEGICFCHRYHLEKLLASKYDFIDENVLKKEVIRLSGGAARAKVFAQMFADVCGIKVETLAANEIGSLGCAIVCAKALGDYTDIKNAVENMVHISGKFLPNVSKKKIYDKKYKVYKKIIESLDSVWEDMQRLI